MLRIDVTKSIVVFANNHKNHNVPEQGEDSQITWYKLYNGSSTANTSPRRPGTLFSPILSTISKIVVVFLNNYKKHNLSLKYSMLENLRIITYLHVKHLVWNRPFTYGVSKVVFLELNLVIELGHLVMKAPNTQVFPNSINRGGWRFPATWSPPPSVEHLQLINVSRCFAVTEHKPSSVHCVTPCRCYYNHQGIDRSSGRNCSQLR